jgi:hypothetical protein
MGFSFVASLIVPSFFWVMSSFSWETCLFNAWLFAIFYSLRFP